jgi:hypothetical protein
MYEETDGQTTTILCQHEHSLPVAFSRVFDNLPTFFLSHCLLHLLLDQKRPRSQVLLVAKLSFFQMHFPYWLFVAACNPNRVS